MAQVFDSENGNVARWWWLIIIGVLIATALIVALSTRS